jgi:hypothetical protein
MVKRQIIFIISLVCFLLCFGCTQKVTEIQYVEKPVYVEVPVVQKIEVERVKKPVYYIKNINKNSSANEVAEAYINTIKELNAYIKKLELIVEPLYKKVEK